MEVEVTQVFPTLIGRLQIPDADAMNRELQGFIMAEESRYPSLGRSNVGGWHSRLDFLGIQNSAISALTTWVNWALRRMIEATAGACTFQGTLSATGWV